ncbi:MAG: phosphatase PAP2 family protein [Muribaculaceae bacterium]|nr:phosphatase PAP2 family protein [Muribaculaceae bacterium]
MRLHHIATYIIILVTSLRAAAVEPDTLSVPLTPSSPRVDINPYIPALAFGVGALGTGVAGRYSYSHHFHIDPIKIKSDRGTNYLEYAPLALPWVAKVAGVRTRSGWGRMAVSQAISVGIMAATVKAMKDGISSQRPDGSDYRSFPSGHTAWAFMGATAAANELAATSAWYAFGAYTFATGIAVERVIDRHHYPTDVMAGAGIGILSSELGYILGDLIFGQHQLSIRGRDLRDNSNFSFLSVETGLNLPLGRVRAGQTIIERLPALSAGFRGGFGISDHWGLGLELGLLSTPLIVNVNYDKTYVKPLTALGFMVAPYYTCALSKRFSIMADVGAGYRKNFALNVDDNAVEAGGGTPVGKVDLGCVVRFTGRFSAKATVGYEISHYKFNLRPSESYHTPEHASTSGTTSSLLLSISSRYEF